MTLGMYATLFLMPLFLQTVGGGIGSPSWGCNAARVARVLPGLLKIRGARPPFRCTTNHDIWFGADGMRATRPVDDLAGSRHCPDRIRLFIDWRRLRSQQRPAAFRRRIGRSEGTRSEERRVGKECR